MGCQDAAATIDGILTAEPFEGLPPVLNFISKFRFALRSNRSFVLWINPLSLLPVLLV
jgi:hypothetical protein